MYVSAALASPVWADSSCMGCLRLHNQPLR